MVDTSAHQNDHENWKEINLEISYMIERAVALATGVEDVEH